MAIDKGKIDAGQGGRRGHSNMDHWIYSHELKEASRKARRLDAGRAVRSGLAERDAPSAARPARAAKSTTHPNVEAFPKGLSGPALRALHGAGIRSLADAARWSDKDLAALHGMGPKALGILRRALKSPAASRGAADARQRVRAYLDALHPDARRVLTRMRNAIHSAVPRGEAGFSYGIPCVRRDGKVIVWYAAWTKHAAMYPIGPAITRAMGDALAGYDVSKGTVRFPFSNPPAAALVRRLVKARLASLG